MKTEDLSSISEFESKAKELLRTEFEQYFNGGADSENTLRSNLSAFRKIELVPKVLVDVSEVNLNIDTILGGENRCSLPIGICPSACHTMAHPDGELATARAAQNAGTIYIQSNLSNYTIEDIAKVAPDAQKWIQIYPFKRREITEDLIRRAEMNRFAAVVVTVDSPIKGNMSHPPLKNLIDPKIRRNFCGNLSKYLPAENEADTPRFAVEQFNQSVTWADIKWIKSLTHLPLILKGILRPDDALKASELGVSAIIVSNHGGRQLDGALATIKALPAIVEALKNSATEVYLDGGVRTGTDVFKALALGANMVFIGRPIVWGLAVDGQKGVERILKIIHDELRHVMMLSGCNEVKSIDSSFVTA